MNTTLSKIDQEKRKIGYIALILEPHDYRIYYANIDKCHQCGISVAESQTYLLAKHPQRQGSKEKRLFLQASFLVNFSKIGLLSFPKSEIGGYLSKQLIFFVIM